LSRPFSPRSSASAGSFVRVNGKIRAREVRVIGVDGSQLGVISLADAINQARANGVDLVEIAPNATPPVCRLVDYGKFRYEQAKKEKEAKKHHHANKVKEVQLSPSIDPHDFGVKLGHAIDFLCEEMKVKISLRFRGREMAHKEFGFQTVEKFLKDVAAYGHPDSAPKLIGKGITVMLSPLPRNKRGKNPRQNSDGEAPPAKRSPEQPHQRDDESVNKRAAAEPSGGFANNPFATLEVKAQQ
jgi:translation initiation factor IF-3